MSDRNTLAKGPVPQLRQCNRLDYYPDVTVKSQQSQAEGTKRKEEDEMKQQSNPVLQCSLLEYYERRRWHSAPNP